MSLDTVLNLQVDIDANSGFCFGVVYAIEMAEEILDDEGRLYCLGDIVHNDEEVKRLEDKGLMIITHEQLLNLRGEKVLIRAHGEPPETYRIAVENDITLIDASCPVVLKLQNRIRNSHESGETIFLYGKHGHAEVKGLMGQVNNEAHVFQDYTELETHQVPDTITLYSQTTKSTHNFYQIKEKLEARGVEVKAHDTICRQVSNRDGELREFAKKYDLIIFVSGTKSSNGKVLYEICKANNPQTYFVSNASDLDSSWFGRGEKVGICGATSTPMWLMEEIRNKLITF